jgi:hydroxypyruvate reductase
MRLLVDEAVRIFLETLESVSIDRIVAKRVRLEGDSLLLDGEQVEVANDVVLIALGKASIALAHSFETLLGPRLRDGLAVTDRGHRLNIRSRVIVAGHPVPDANSVAAGRAVLELVQSCSNKSLIVFLISGGGSSLVELPISSEISLADLAELNRLLVLCGASIREINTIRKHLSAIKGGRLGFAAQHTRSVAFCVSDVNRGDLRSLASNPLLPDDASLDQFHEVLNRYGLLDRLPRSIRGMVLEGRVPWLPSAGNGQWGPGSVSVLLDNRDALGHAADLAVKAGFRAEICEDHVEGRFDKVADALLERLLDFRLSEKGRNVCLISGGEVSCEVPGGVCGLGGRNQHFVLYSAARFAGLGIDKPVAVLSCGTDGVDGNSVAAGAVADTRTVEAAAVIGLDATEYLRSFDSYSFFRKFGGAIVTGPTGNNVRDIRILLAGP